jgi:hypothetical protein
MTVNEIANSISICGLVCALSSCKSSCTGCRSQVGDCSIKKCSSKKELDYCFLCEEFPCHEGMFKNIRLNAFNMIAKEEGLQKLAEYLLRNYQNGIQYHRRDGIKGDYDRLQKEQEVISLLKNGRPDPYDICPTYESQSFCIRLISIDDAEDLVKCYSNPKSQRFFNYDPLGNDDYFVGFTLKQMRDLIWGWLNKDYKTRFFVRFSIIDKLLDKAVGTIEMYPQGRRGILRIDILPEYERQINIGELLYISDNFFYDFICNIIVSKAIPEASERTKALIENGYTPYPKNDNWDREYYFMKPSIERKQDD